jgi:hypothetical protein
MDKESGFPSQIHVICAITLLVHPYPQFVREVNVGNSQLFFHMLRQLLIIFGASLTGPIQVHISLPTLQESVYNVRPIYVFIVAPAFNCNHNENNDCNSL